MASFKEIRNLVLECYVDGIIDEDDFMLLYDINQSKNPEFPHENYELFNFDALDPVECVADFRVEKQDIPRLADALGIPPVIKCQQRSICDGTEALCMLLRRFAYPCCLSDMIARFGRPVPVMSMITKEVMNFRGGSRGRVQGVRTPHRRDDLQFSNTTGILQKKNYVVYWC